MKPLIKWSLWQRRRSTFGWAVGSAFLIFINLVFYPSFKDQAAELQKSFENLPPSAVQFLGGSTDFFSPVGFLNSQIYFIMLPLLVGVLAITIGHKIIANDEQEGTIELLLARPISRGKILAAKAISALLIITIVNFVAFFVTITLSKIVGVEVPAPNIILASLSCYLLSVSFGAMAFMISSLGKTRVISIPLTATYALGGYVITSLASNVTWLHKPSKIFGFYYYRPTDNLSGEITFRYMLFFIVFSLICFLVAYLVFRKRDLD